MPISYKRSLLKLHPEATLSSNKETRYTIRIKNGHEWIVAARGTTPSQAWRNAWVACTQHGLKD